MLRQELLRNVAISSCLLFLGCTLVVGKEPPVQEAEMAGYLLVPHEKVPDSFNAGFSLYVSAWPLLEKYPGNRFQTGLFGTWMHAQYEGPEPTKLYSDIEGGLGWWRDTRFATKTPKFIMGGVALNFREWANGPGAGKGRDWKKPSGKYGVAQLSPWVLWPPDGLNLQQGTCGDLLGYGYLALPLAESKSQTAGKEVPTGDQCWTLFLNSGNFKGPVAFFTPYFWSQASTENAELAGLFLDTRPAKPNKALQMETQYIPAYLADDREGNTFARIAPTSFPRQHDGKSVAVHRMAAYSRSALWDDVKGWLEGGSVASGVIAPSGTAFHHFSDKGGSTWRIYPPNTAKENKIGLAWSSFATPIAIDETTFGYRWNEQLVSNVDSPDGPLVTLPQYFRLQPKGEKKEWVVVDPKDVPLETNLQQQSFPTPVSTPPEPYVTPDASDSCWKSPGPSAGPFEVTLGDGSRVTYYWYRFADQPALLNADLSDSERERIQKRVEKLHRHWTKDREYLPPPASGQLANLDPAVLVTPPAGLEIGYVPIVTRQEKAR